MVIGQSNKNTFFKMSLGGNQKIVVDKNDIFTVTFLQ